MTYGERHYSRRSIKLFFYLVTYMMIAIGLYAFYQYETKGCLINCDLNGKVINQSNPTGRLANSDSLNPDEGSEEDRARIELNNRLRLAHNHLDFYHLNGDEYNRERAIHYFSLAAITGSSDAQYNLGRLFEEEGKIDGALRCYLKASDQHIPEASFHLAKIYLTHGRYRHLEKAVTYLQSAVDQHYYPAYSSLAKLYATGSGVEQDILHAIQLYQTLINEDHYYSGLYSDLAALYQNNNLLMDALRYYYRAINAKESGANYWLGHFYRDGLAEQENLNREQVEEFYRLAYRFYQASLEEGDKRANLPLARLYLTGDGVALNYEWARYYLFEALAERETQVDALIELATLYRLGLGVEPNSHRAIQYIETAVNLQDAKAAYILGLYHLMGYGSLRKDSVRAKSYFKMAWERGDDAVKTDVDKIMARYYHDDQLFRCEHNDE